MSAVREDASDAQVEAARSAWARAVRTTDGLAIGVSAYAVVGTATAVVLAATARTTSLSTLFLLPSRFDSGGTWWVWDVPTGHVWWITLGVLMPPAIATLVGARRTRRRRAEIEAGLAREGGRLPVAGSSTSPRPRRGARGAPTAAQRRAREDAAARRRVVRQGRWVERRRAYPAPLALLGTVLAATAGTWWVLALVVAWSGPAAPDRLRSVAPGCWVPATWVSVALVVVLAWYVGPRPPRRSPRVGDGA
ncbi:hypothetical protein [Cellulosimicrobium sp. SH8]|uniref:hypothetical protein n=1 Tax=Cellulosimicrobium sp. SH8 TaxID=2952936 RepID=UPI0021F3B3EC|nr:hypothetical protein [Cellulosimicrobium sp. SH8]